MTNMQPSNWLSPNNDIAFRLTFRRAQEKKVVMNSKPSGSSWHTKEVLSVPFNGQAKVDVSYDTSTGFMVRLRDLTGNYGDVVYTFADRIPVPYAIASVNGEATGTEIECPDPPLVTFQTKSDVDLVNFLVDSEYGDVVTRNIGSSSHIGACARLYADGHELGALLQKDPATNWPKKDADGEYALTDPPVYIVPDEGHPELGRSHPPELEQQGQPDDGPRSD